VNARKKETKMAIKLCEQGEMKVFLPDKKTMMRQKIAKAFADKGFSTELKQKKYH
jgi:hypothetical protein